MADNGKIIRNGAEIQIDENGNVVARPAEGQEFIVEDDARVGTLEAEEISISSLKLKLLERKTPTSTKDDPVTFDFDVEPGINYKLVFDYKTRASSGDCSLQIVDDGELLDDGQYGYWDQTGTKISGQDSILIVDTGAFATISGAVTFSSGIVGNNFTLGSNIRPGRLERINDYSMKGTTSGDGVGRDIESVKLTIENGGLSQSEVELWEVL